MQQVLHVSLHKFVDELLASGDDVANGAAALGLEHENG